MLLGIVSDTHGHTRNAADAVRLLESLGIEQLIHCGDIGSPEIVPIVAKWPTHFVLGNVDDRSAALEKAVAKAGATLHGRFGEVVLSGVSIAFLHGDDPRRLADTIASRRYRLVFHGHTHVAACSERNGVTVVNPGALYRAARHTVATVDLPSVEVEHFDVGTRD